jgi:hypothetical protein
MGRKARDVEPGGIYHVRTRGNNREPLYFDDHDRAARLVALEGVARKLLNPVRARMRRSPELWPWSSYRASAGLELAPAFLADSELLKLFSSRPAAARKAYRAFVHDGLVQVSDTACGAGEPARTDWPDS